MAQIEHAYSLLSSGGRLVSVISEGPIFHSDKRSTAFREGVDEIGEESEQLPEDAFQGRDRIPRDGRSHAAVDAYQGRQMIREGRTDIMNHLRQPCL
jgi:hypothetical protein